MVYVIPYQRLDPEAERVLASLRYKNKMTCLRYSLEVVNFVGFIDSVAVLSAVMRDIQAMHVPASPLRSRGLLCL